MKCHCIYLHHKMLAPDTQRPGRALVYLRYTGMCRFDNPTFQSFLQLLIPRFYTFFSSSQDPFSSSEFLDDSNFAVQSNILAFLHSTKETVFWKLIHTPTKKRKQDECPPGPSAPPSSTNKHQPTYRYKLIHPIYIQTFKEQNKKELLLSLIICSDACDTVEGQGCFRKHPWRLLQCWQHSNYYKATEILQASNVYKLIDIIQYGVKLQ